MATSTPSSSSPPPRALARFRERINDLDSTLVMLLRRRSRLSVSVARVKRGAGLPLHMPAREDEIIRQAKRAARGPLTAQAVERIFRVILTEMRSAQRRHTSTRRLRANARVA